MILLIYMQEKIQVECAKTYFLKNMYLFIDCTRFFLQHVGSLSFLAAHVIFSCMWDLSPWSGIKPGPPALGPWSLSHWTTREYPCSSVAKLCPALCNCMNYRCQTSLSFTIPQNLLKLMTVESVMPSNHLILWCPLLPSSLSAFNFPSIRVFSNESVLCIR